MARVDVIACVTLLLFALLADITGADVWFTHLYGTASGFAWRDHWFTSDLMHRGGRVVSWLLFGATLWALWWPWRAVARVPFRTRVWWLVRTLTASLQAAPARIRNDFWSIAFSEYSFLGSETGPRHLLAWQLEQECDRGAIWCLRSDLHPC